MSDHLTPDHSDHSDNDDSGRSVGVGLGDPGYEEAAQQTDQGVAVGSADVEADARRASGEGRSDEDDDDYRDEARAQESTDQGVPVGSADVEADRQNAEQRRDG